MTRPFIPFPIFPSYDHWQPNQVKRFPVNVYVSARLNEVDESCLPFINAWYADRYLNWIAHSWSPQTPHLQYYKTINGLEKMLNWSFANNLSLLDWTDADFRDYVGFVQTPDSDWASPSIQPRFLVSPGKDYHDYPINPEWKLFHTSRASKSSDAIDRNVWKREIRSVTQFMDFYLKDVSAMRPNVAAAKLDWLSFIDQFMRNERGNWLEIHPKNGSTVPLPPAFSRTFDRYLIYLNIDASQPLPALSLFPREDSVGVHDLKGLWLITCSIRQNLADMALASDNPDIVEAASEIRRLTTALVSNRPVSET